MRRVASRIAVSSRVWDSGEAALRPALYLTGAWQPGRVLGPVRGCGKRGVSLHQPVRAADKFRLAHWRSPKVACGTLLLISLKPITLRRVNKCDVALSQLKTSVRR